MVQYGPAEPSLRAHRIARFRSHPWLCWDLLSVLELQGRAGCRRCFHLLGKRNCYHSQFKWANAVGGLNSHLAYVRWPGEFRKRRGGLPDFRYPRGREGTETQRAAARTGEVIGERWNELDLAEQLWIIQAERMKMEMEHRVPLTDASMAIPERLRQSRSGDFIFPGRAAAQQYGDV